MSNKHTATVHISFPAQGKEKLIVPLTFKHGKVFITDVRIDYGQKWLNKHWRAIQSAYGKAAFFEHYSEDLEKVLFRKTVFLYDLNIELLSMCLKWLKWDLEIKESMTYEKAPAITDFGPSEFNKLQERRKSW